MQWFFHACPVCGGDLHEDIEDKGWTVCFMCARTFRLSEIRAANADRETVAAVRPDESVELPLAA
jgi:uncharacterized Zn finger protein (UPF0148 family)